MMLIAILDSHMCGLFISITVQLVMKPFSVYMLSCSITMIIMYMLSCSITMIIMYMLSCSITMIIMYMCSKHSFSLTT